MLSLRDYITANEKYPLFWDQFFALPSGIKTVLEKNAEVTIARSSQMLTVLGYLGKVHITSGWRPLKHNNDIGGAPHSRHLYAEAIDIWDPNKEIGLGFSTQIEKMSEIGLWMESLLKTHSGTSESDWWVHVQIVAPSSGHRIFMP